MGDNIVFYLATAGFIGVKVQNYANKVSNVKSTRSGKSGLRTVFLPLLFAYMLVAWGVISAKQERGDYLPQTIFVQFGDEQIPDLAFFSGIYE